MSFLQASHISKRFGVTQALDDVSVSFTRGEVHALMGENGAGKSTLGKCIAGLYTHDTGTVTIDAIAVPPGDMEAAFHLGIRLVHQELAQCPNMSVAENLSLHDMPVHRGAAGVLRVVNTRAVRDRAARLVHALDPSIDVMLPLGGLSPGRRQICQIAAAIDEEPPQSAHAQRLTHAFGPARGPRVIVLDEPTSSLSVAEADRLMAITRSLAGRGITVLYVSHRMGEIFQVCDRVSVLRDGRFVATNVTKEIDEPTLVEQMIGRRIETAKRGEFQGGASASLASAAEPNANASSLPAAHSPVLRVNNLASPGTLRDISFAVHAGEVVGIGGLVGAGRSELLNAVFGLDARATGSIHVAGAPLRLGSVREAIRMGVGYVPEDRRNLGLFFQLGVGENTVLPFMQSLAHLCGVRAFLGEKSLVAKKFADFRVKAASVQSLPGELSGGNQQKLLLARWMGEGTRVLLLDEPTRGIDVGTKAEVYKLVRAAAGQGCAVVLVSSEMPELLALSDRVLVMCAGAISGELRGSEMTQANILRLATVDSRSPRSAAS